MDETTARFVARFATMVAGSGGELTLLDAEPDLVRVSYRAPDATADCADDACVLPGRELEQLMNETLQRIDPSIRVEVETLR